eukprot:866592-Prorocentrum_minimum.AAC.2
MFSFSTSLQVTELPVRTAKFITRKQWIVCGADDMFIRVYNYNTSEQVHPLLLRRYAHQAVGLGEGLAVHASVRGSLPLRDAGATTT